MDDRSRTRCVPSFLLALSRTKPHLNSSRPIVCMPFLRLYIAPAILRAELGQLRSNLRRRVDSRPSLISALPSSPRSPQPGQSRFSHTASATFESRIRHLKPSQSDNQRPT